MCYLITACGEEKARKVTKWVKLYVKLYKNKVINITITRV